VTKLLGLPKRVRLLKRADFSAIFADRQRVHSNHFLVLAKANDLSHPRFGLAVAKKHLRTAVKRNIVKRQARESFRALQQQLPNMDFVLLTKKQITTDWPQLDKKQIRQEVDSLLKKLNKLKVSTRD